MDSDLILIIGLVLGLLCIPAAMAAYSENRPPRAPLITLIIAAAMVIFALQSKPGGYAVSDIPEVFFSVVARYLP